MIQGYLHFLKQVSFVFNVCTIWTLKINSLCSCQRKKCFLLLALNESVILNLIQFLHFFFFYCKKIYTIPVKQFLLIVLKFCKIRIECRTFKHFRIYTSAADTVIDKYIWKRPVFGSFSGCLIRKHAILRKY